MFFTQRSVVVRRAEEGRQRFSFHGGENAGNEGWGDTDVYKVLTICSWERAGRRGICIGI